MNGIALWHSMVLRQPETLDFSNTESWWPSWLAQYEDYAFASGISTATKNGKVHLLLYSVKHVPQSVAILAFVPAYLRHALF